MSFSGGDFSRFGFLWGGGGCCCFQLGQLCSDGSVWLEGLKRSSREGPLSPSNDCRNFFAFGGGKLLLFTLSPAFRDVY